MNSTIKNILAIILGWIGGSIINMALIQVGHSIYPIPNIDINNMNALSKVMPTLGTNYFIFPFLAHALGTFVGAIIAYSMATNNKMKFAYIIGVFFLLGGIMINFMITGPLWFITADLLLAYIPMAWLGGQLAQKISKK
ncbi:hypothetical protein ES677_00980 [Bizionia gelidisalsuginis]|uniref:Uncharacterized protein n=2 Tax=Bizionia TaxID=283785 RepID=A0A8H2QG01_9FLAO|nr:MULTISPECIES: hypothetical protein [Bizionia]TYB77337.1 hypothetical protein ES676_03330 [Bizionia saleffrena]TYC17981.1 hypothetical protein ES677_00980 [Bizionia gelidisalsuginis]